MKAHEKLDCWCGAKKHVIRTLPGYWCRRLPISGWSKDAIFVSPRMNKVKGGPQWLPL